MESINEDRYIKSLEDALKRAKNKNKEKIEEIVKSDFVKEKISQEVYRKSIKKIDEHFEKMPMRARIKITKEQLESQNGVKIEGHKYEKIEGLEDAER